MTKQDYAILIIFGALMLFGALNIDKMMVM